MAFEDVNLDPQPGKTQPWDIAIDVLVAVLAVCCCLVSWRYLPSLAKKTIWNSFRNREEGTSEVELSLRGEAPDYLELASTTHKSEPAPKNGAKRGAGANYWVKAGFFLITLFFLFGFYNNKLVNDWLDGALKRSWASAVTSSSVTPFVPVLCLLPCFLMHTTGLTNTISTKVVDFLNSFGVRVNYDTGMVAIGTVMFSIAAITSLLVVKYVPVSETVAGLILTLTALSASGEAFVEPAIYDLAAIAGPTCVDACMIGSGFSGIILSLASAVFIKGQVAEPRDLLASSQECVIKSSLTDESVGALLNEWTNQKFTRLPESDTWTSSKLGNIDVIAPHGEDTNSIKTAMTDFLDNFKAKAKDSPKFKSFDLFYLPDIDHAYQNAVTMVLAVTLLGTIFIPVLFKRLKKSTSAAPSIELPSEDKSHNDDDDNYDDEVKAVWADVWPAIIAQSLTFLITGATYPAFMIKMVRRTDSSADTWFVTVMLVRSVSDAVFKFLGGYLMSKRLVNLSPRSMFWLAVLRIPIFAILLVLPFPIFDDRKKPVALVILFILMSSGAMLAILAARVPSSIVHNSQRLPEKLKATTIKAIQHSLFVMLYLGWVLGNCVGQLLSRLYTIAGLFDN